MGSIVVKETFAYHESQFRNIYTHILNNFVKSNVEFIVDDFMIFLNLFNLISFIERLDFKTNIFNFVVVKLHYNNTNYFVPVYCNSENNIMLNKVYDTITYDNNKSLSEHKNDIIKFVQNNFNPNSLSLTYLFLTNVMKFHNDDNKSILFVNDIAISNTFSPNNNLIFLSNYLKTKSIPKNVVIIINEITKKYIHYLNIELNKHLNDLENHNITNDLLTCKLSFTEQLLLSKQELFTDISSRIVGSRDIDCIENYNFQLSCLTNEIVKIKLYLQHTNESFNQNDIQLSSIKNIINNLQNKINVFQMIIDQSNSFIFNS